VSNDELINIARKAQNASYSPYSGFRVGAALLCESGKVFEGANVENSSYGLTVCAERIAVFKAVTTGEKDFKAIAIAGDGQGFTYPCGACLQVLAEFSPGIKVIVADETNKYQELTLHDLLPQAFGLKK
jgi:cytidine deaminase